MISQETSKRIAKEATSYSDVSHDYLTHGDWERERNSYIAGAEAEATRAERLLTLLKKINDDAGTDLSMPLWEELERMIDNYNKPDK